MSTDPQNPGGKLFAQSALDRAKAIIEEGVLEEQQGELLEPLTADELDDARTELGGNPGVVTVMRHARARRGRPKNSRNRRTDDFAKYLSQFGQDPAITLMQIQATAAEELVARSAMLDPEKRRMSLADATALRIRCAEALMPFIHGKVPVKVDATIRGVHVIEEVSRPTGAGGVIIDQAGEPLGILPMEDGR